VLYARWRCRRCRLCRWWRPSRRSACVSLTHQHTHYLVNSALHPSGVAKSSTSFGWGRGGNVSSAGWHVTLCGMWVPGAVWQVRLRIAISAYTTTSNKFTRRQNYICILLQNDTAADEQWLARVVLPVHSLIIISYIQHTSFALTAFMNQNEHGDDDQVVSRRNTHADTMPPSLTVTLTLDLLTSGLLHAYRACHEL